MAREIRRESKRAARASLHVHSTYMTSTPYQSQINHASQPSSPSPGVGRSYRSGAPHVALRLSGVCLHPPDQPQTTRTAQNLPTDLSSPMQFSARTDKHPQIDWSSSGRVEAISPKHKQVVRVWPSKADEVGNYPAEALTPRSLFPPVTGLGADDPPSRQASGRVWCPRGCVFVLVPGCLDLRERVRQSDL